MRKRPTGGKVLVNDLFHQKQLASALCTVKNSVITSIYDNKRNGGGKEEKKQSRETISSLPFILLWRAAVKINKPSREKEIKRVIGNKPKRGERTKRHGTVAVNKQKTLIRPKEVLSLAELHLTRLFFFCLCKHFDRRQSDSARFEEQSIASRQSWRVFWTRSPPTARSVWQPAGPCPCRSRQSQTSERCRSRHHLTKPAGNARRQS